MSSSGLTSGYSISLPVARAKHLPQDLFVVEGEVQGTCFSLGNNFMLTAGHVAEAVSGTGLSGVVGLYEPSGQTFKAALVVDAEGLPCDLGVLKVRFVVEESANWLHTLKWLRNPLKGFQMMRCLGYPYGLHVVGEEKALVQRAFQGHVVASLLKYKPLNYTGEPFSAYELSFQAPLGLSGAPLLTSEGTPCVAGMVIGNSKTGMQILSSEEIEKEGAEKKTFEVYEFLSLGIAVQARAIYSTESKLLGGTFEDYFEKNQMLV